MNLKELVHLGGILYFVDAKAKNINYLNWSFQNSFHFKTEIIHITFRYDINVIHKNIL